MAWNEPGKDEQDPWGERGGRKQDGPPDLDDVIKTVRDKLFGGNKQQAAPSGGDSERSAAGIWIFIIVAALIWLASGIYIVAPAERGVVMRFGEYTQTTLPGPHWHLPTPFERVERVDVDASRNAEIGFRSANGNRQSGGPVHSESLMLTKDENIIDLGISVQYQIKEAEKYLFNVRNPDLTLRQMTESAVREVVGQSTMDFILTERSEITAQVEKSLQTILDARETGLIITSVNMQNVQPPTEVKAAFADAVKAEADKFRQVNEAEAYANDILPRARGAAFRIEQEADGYKSQTIAKATGESSRFSQVRAEYERAPAITEERLYLESMEGIYQRANKVMIDLPEGGNNVLYLPIDKMAGTGGTAARDMPIIPPSFSANTATTETTQRDAENSRSRGGR